MNGQDGYDHHSNVHQENFNPAGGGRYPPHLPNSQVPVAQPPRREREYNWKLAGATDCSASCGKGMEYSWCYIQYIHVLGFFLLQTSRKTCSLNVNFLISNNIQLRLEFPKINVVI